MKKIYLKFILSSFICCASCNNTCNVTAQQEEDKKEMSATVSEPIAQNGSIVGEWKQQYTCFDKNGNYKLDSEEKTPSNNTVGFNWFKFNADGTCLRDKEMKFKSTYKIINKDDNKELVIQNVHGYKIIELTEKELILGAEGAFMVFKKV